MKSKKDPEIFLKHIIESIDQIEMNVAGLSKKTFLTVVPIQDAVIRRLEIIGEAVKNLPESFKVKYPTVAWKSIAGTRDILIHEYFGVDLELVWAVVGKDVPKLKKQVISILKELKK